jgi:hypothetical protein
MPPEWQPNKPREKHPNPRYEAVRPGSRVMSTFVAWHSTVGLMAWWAPTESDLHHCPLLIYHNKQNYEKWPSRSIHNFGGIRIYLIK